MRNAMKTKTVARKITREYVMDAALAIADRDGLEAVTIRALAVEVGGVTPMALYTYFADKESLYDGMRERTLARIIATTKQSSWQVALEDIARSIFRTLQEHPNRLPLLTRTSGVPMSAVGFFDRLFEMMLKDGFELAQILQGYSCMISFAIGMALVERTMMGSGENSLSAKRIALLRELMPRLPKERYPNLVSVASAIDQWNFADVFGFGIRSLIGGIDEHCKRQAKRRSRNAKLVKRPPSARQQLKTGL